MGRMNIPLNGECTAVHEVGGGGLRWAQVSVITTHEGADLIGNILMELGAAGTQIGRAHV